MRPSLQSNPCSDQKTGSALYDVSYHQDTNRSGVLGMTLQSCCQKRSSTGHRRADRMGKCLSQNSATHSNDRSLPARVCTSCSAATTLSQPQLAPTGRWGGKDRHPSQLRGCAQPAIITRRETIMPQPHETDGPLDRSLECPSCLDV